IAESPVFEEVRQRRERASVPIVVLFQNHWRLVLLGALLFAANNAAGYMTTGGYVQSYSVNVLGMDSTPVLIAVMLSAVVWLGTTLLGGWLSDRYGRIFIFRVGFVIQLAWIFPFFALINTADLGLLVLSLSLFSVGLGLTYGPLSALYAEMYPTSVRYSGAAITYALGAVLGGAFAPTIAQALQSSTGNIYTVGVYLAILTIVGAVMTFCIRDRSGAPLHSTAEPESESALEAT
ncbi:MAG: MFS transporter, partial [Actinomycetes bacterium]